MSIVRILSPEIPLFFVEAGADLNLCNLDNWTALH
jgi:ankyrin repeat protein